jgi:hypothetical protein
MALADGSFAGVMASRIQQDAHLLAERWFERLSTLLVVPSTVVFPGDALLDDIPAVIKEIGKVVGAPANGIRANTFVVMKARELGELRSSQHVSVHQLLREYEVLRGILEIYALEQASALRLTPDLHDVMTYVRRVNETVGLLALSYVYSFV